MLKFVYFILNDRIMTRSLSILTLIVLTCMAFSACKKDSDSKGGKDAPEKLVLASYGETTYTLVSSSSLYADAKAFAASFDAVTGATLNMGTTTPYQRDDEIIVGTGKDCEEAVKSIKHGYVIKTSGTRVIIAGTDDTWTVLALEAFYKQVINATKYKVDGGIEIPSGLRISQSTNDPQMIAMLLSTGHPFTIKAEMVGSCVGSGNCNVAQGAASDGKHVYFVLRDSRDENGMIFKYTLDPFRFVANSEAYKCYHANDMTFDSAHNRVIAIHASGDTGGITAFDANTLTPTEIRTSLGIGGITYNFRRNVYGITQSGTKYQIADANFKKTADYGRSDNMTSKYTAQGMGSDDSYVYFPMSPTRGKSTDNVLVTYNWSGNYVGEIHIDTSLESESMFYAAGEYYVNFYAGGGRGAHLYRIRPVISFTYAD